MNTLLLLSLFFLGASLGSFIGAKYYREKKGSNLHGRSLCDGCGRQLKWYENIPVTSYIFLYFQNSAKCKNCQTQIPKEYFLLETLSGLYLVLLFLFLQINNFLGLTCKQWEESIQPVENLNKRLAILRIGIVLSNRGGAFVEFIKSLKFRVASIIGNGNQIISWIHIDDVCNIFINSIENKSIKGAFNCVAPNPVSNKILMKTIGNIYCNNKFISIFIPTFLIKIFLGEFSIEVLKSTNVSSKKVEETGFEFQYPNIEKAIEQLKNN